MNERRAMGRLRSAFRGAVLGLGLAAALGACGDAMLSGPPELHVGRDECAGCGMILNDAKCAGALLVAENGTRAHLLFDDIGCMVEFERDHSPVVVSRFVHDYARGAWTDAADAVFVVSDAGHIATPMGSGTVAYADAAAAAAKAGESQGKVVRWSDLLASAPSGPR